MRQESGASTGVATRSLGKGHIHVIKVTKITDGERLSLVSAGIVDQIFGWEGASRMM
jgi:hypothetical protein